MVSDLAEFEALHKENFAVTNIISTMRERIEQLKKAPFQGSHREYVPVVAAEEVYEHIQLVETDSVYRESLERGIKTCESLVRAVTPVIATELAKYGVVALVTDERKGVDFLNTQALYMIKSR